MACGCGVGCGGAEQGGCWAASTINAGGDFSARLSAAGATTASLKGEQSDRRFLACGHRLTTFARPLALGAFCGGTLPRE